MCAERAESTTPGDPEEWEEWLRTAEEVLDETVEREGTLECEFDEFAVGIPMAWGEEADRARWGLDGTVRVRIDGDRRPLAAWLDWWYDRVPTA
jgi:hypothetical protein